MTRRFIAGAICPECGALDRIVLYDHPQEGPVRECIECGFLDKQPEFKAPELVQTRLSTAEVAGYPKADNDVRPLLIVEDTDASRT